MKLLLSVNDFLKDILRQKGMVHQRNRLESAFGILICSRQDE